MRRARSSSAKTEIISLDQFAFTAKQLSRAVGLLKSGELVVVPTETVYGLAVDPLDPQAVLSFYEVKGRDFNKPLALAISSLSQLNELVKEVPVFSWELIEAFWPGPLTLIFAKSEGVADGVTAGLPTVGIRFADHPVTRALVEEFGRPFALTSANVSGHISPVDISQVLVDLDGKVPLVIDCGETKYKQESTIVDLTSDPPQVLREGALPSEKIFDLFRRQ